MPMLLRYRSAAVPLPLPLALALALALPLPVRGPCLALRRRLHSSSNADADADELRVARAWLAALHAETLPLRSIGDLSFSRSSGPGGQNVNK
jgi:hypothetical protein